MAYKFISYHSQSLILCSVEKNLNALPSPHPRSTIVALGLISKFFIMVKCLSKVGMYGAFFDLHSVIRIA